VLCIPGLTRNSKDFNFIAGHISKTRRVLTTDLRGRGRSAYDRNWRNYTPAMEALDIAALLRVAGVSQVTILGTSRGGVVAMVMAMTVPQLLKAVILNDIGGENAPPGLKRIRETMGNEPYYDTWKECAAGLRKRFSDMFPGLSDAQWSAFAHATYTESYYGLIVPDYDPRLATTTREGAHPFHSEPPNPSMWPLFAALKSIPTLVLRAENSDLLAADTLARMQKEKPDLITALVKNRGHVPFLDEPEAVAAIDAFLERAG
jgi:pimeloyl-ACP methyl ester carboxylesterase